MKPTLPAAIEEIARSGRDLEALVRRLAPLEPVADRAGAGAQAIATARTSISTAQVALAQAEFELDVAWNGAEAPGLDGELRDPDGADCRHGFPIRPDGSATCGIDHGLE